MRGVKSLDPQIQILYVIASLDIGGTERQLYLLLKHLDRNRFAPHVVSLSPGGYWIQPIRDLGIELITLERRTNYELKRLISLTGMIRNRNPHIVHSYQPPANAYAGLAATMAKHSKMIASRRSFDFETQSNALKKIIDRTIYRNADAVVCNSSSLYENLKNRYGERINAVVIHNGIEMVDPPRFERASEVKNMLGVPLEAPVVGTVGRLIPIKNHRLFLDIASGVFKKRPDVYFVLVGDGPLENELRTYAETLGIADRVVFTGQRDDVPLLLNAFDIFLFTSSNHYSEGEGLPNAVMEAMVSGLPCVASRAGGTQELFQDGEAGYLVEPEAREAYLGRTLTLLEDKILRRSMGQMGRTIIQKRYSVSAMVSQFEDLYTKVLNGNTAH